MPSMRIGGVALDLVGIPLSEETLTKAKNSDDVFLGAVGWPKWDNNSKHLKLNGAVAASYGSRSVFQFKTHHCLPSGSRSEKGQALAYLLKKLNTEGKLPLNQNIPDRSIFLLVVYMLLFIGHMSRCCHSAKLRTNTSGQNCSCTSRKDEEEDENDKVSGGKELKYLESLS
ncbi:unnamed protein product [Brassica oleracea]